MPKTSIALTQSWTEYWPSRNTDLISVLYRFIALPNWPQGTADSDNSRNHRSDIGHVIWMNGGLSNNFEYSRLERLLWWDPEFRVLIFWHFDRFEWSECIHRSILVTCHLSPDWSLSPTSSAKLMSNLNLRIIWTRLLKAAIQTDLTLC